MNKEGVNITNLIQLIQIYDKFFCCLLHGGRFLKCLDAGKRKRVIEDDDEEGPAAKKSRTDSGCQVIFSIFLVFQLRYEENVKFISVMPLQYKSISTF